MLQATANNHHYKHLSNLCEEFHFRNVVTSPTRLAKTCLDLILVYAAAPHVKTTVVSVDGVSDHDLVLTNFSCKATPQASSRLKIMRKLLPRAIDPAALCDDIESTLQPLPKSADVNAHVTQLSDCITRVLDKHSPICPVVSPAFSKPKPQPWVTPQLKHLLQQRIHLHRKVRTHLSDQQLLQRYRAIQREGTLLNRLLKSQYNIGEFKIRHHNPRGQWAIINSLCIRTAVRAAPAATLADLMTTFAEIVHDPARPVELPLPVADPNGATLLEFDTASLNLWHPTRPPAPMIFPPAS